MSSVARLHSIPEGWSRSAHERWSTGGRLEAIQTVLQELREAELAHNGTPGRDRNFVPRLLQVAYYIFLLNDPLGAARFLEMARDREPDNVEVLRNLGVCLSRGGRLEEAIHVMRHLSRLSPSDPVCFDSLCSSLAELGDFEAARSAGIRALEIKSNRAPRTQTRHWAGIPPIPPSQWLDTRTPRLQVVSFSLWGNDPRYLRGALDNALAAEAIYPGWTLRFHVDESVPAELCAALQGLGAQIHQQPNHAPLRRRLAWRFQVANDPYVGRFLVRDVDSVVSERERSAVEAWVESDQWFHVMRDWWTHTDPMLAGLWGGIGGVLPTLSELLENYEPGAMDTPNIDQWFLRDEVWPLIRQHCMVHDRCFTQDGSRGWPQDDPPSPRHVGQDLYAADRQGQEQRLAQWINRLPCLRTEREEGAALSASQLQSS
jgi:tetratricopeptide (TPR) repeat protein